MKNLKKFSKRPVGGSSRNWKKNVNRKFSDLQKHLGRLNSIAVSTENILRQVNKKRHRKGNELLYQCIPKEDQTGGTYLHTLTIQLSESKLQSLLKNQHTKNASDFDDLGKIVFINLASPLANSSGYSEKHFDHGKVWALNDRSVKKNRKNCGTVQSVFDFGRCM